MDECKWRYRIETPGMYLALPVGSGISSNYRATVWQVLTVRDPLPPIDATQINHIFYGPIPEHDLEVPC